MHILYVHTACVIYMHYNIHLIYKCNICMYSEYIWHVCDIIVYDSVCLLRLGWEAKKINLSGNIPTPELVITNTF